MSRNEYLLCLTAHGDAEKLHQLCHLQASKASAQVSINSLDRLSPTAKQEDRSEKSCILSAPISRPDAIRIKNIPCHFDKEALEVELRKLFDVPKATVHSLALFSSRSKCATVTFPESTNKFIHDILVDKERTLSRRNLEELHFNEEFLFITPLYDAGEEALLDIIAVPGLGTHQFGTFRAPDGEKMWLRDFLPHDILNGRSRVLLYGYDSIVNDSTTVQGIHDIASTCLNTIRLFRRFTKLLYQSSHSTGDSEIFDMWGRFVGFGVPINGLDHKELIERAQGKPNEAIMRDICVGQTGQASYALVQLARSFETCTNARKAEVKYFGESAVSAPRLVPGSPPKPNRIMVVPQRDWIILNTNHSNLVKFRDGDPHYDTVKDNIQCMAEKIIETEATKLQKEGLENTVSSSKIGLSTRVAKVKLAIRQRLRGISGNSS